MISRALTRLLLTGLFTAALLPLAPAQAQEQERTRCFDQTSHCVSDVLLDYWEQHGGLPVFGYPISDQRLETVEGRALQVQWFERDRLEIQRDGQVTAGRLGARILVLQERAWRTFPQIESAPPGCVLFTETGHSLCEPFLSYWSSNGGLERFGYPLTEQMTDTVEDWTGTVQYFERRRMEHHTELPGAQVLLGLLGREVLVAEPVEPVLCDHEIVEGLRYHLRADVYPGSRLGCPAAEVVYGVPAAEQYFEHGTMVYTVHPGYPNGLIYATITEPLPIRYETFPNTWQEGEPQDTGDAEPPAGLYEPVRGFGKVWYSNSQIREALGWATGPEIPNMATVQRFANGEAVWLLNTDFVYTFFTDRNRTNNPNQATAFPRRTAPGSP